MIEDVVCYHEAGHAVSFWHYGIELQYVIVRPQAVDRHRGETKTVGPAPVTDVVDLENDMKCSAAGEIAERLLNPARRLPTDDELIRAFTFAPARAAINPDLAEFVGSGRDRDAKIHNRGVDALTGPEGWLRIWREVEHLILDQLSPAVHMVAGELRRTGRVSGADVATLAKAAMTEGPK